MKKENIIVFCAHPDDQIIGAGGTMAKYAKEGKNVYTVLFSYGESSHLWLKKKVSSDMRAKEAECAEKVIKGKGIEFLGVRDMMFQNDIKSKNIKKKIKKIIEDKKPSKIFTHCREDFHKDHKAVYSAVKESLQELGFECDLFLFDVWNPINIKRYNNPKMYVDITKTFKTKMDALDCFKSQQSLPLTAPLFLTTRFRAFVDGLHSNVKYAERFYKEGE
ncbi:MAG: hypothetical protein GY861_07105 [bacterium]|nr:hypothetical protein [bacterium]